MTPSSDRSFPPRGLHVIVKLQFSLNYLTLTYLLASTTTISTPFSISLGLNTVTVIATYLRVRFLHADDLTLTNAKIPVQSRHYEVLETSSQNIAHMVYLWLYNLSVALSCLSRPDFILLIQVYLHLQCRVFFSWAPAVVIFPLLSSSPCLQSPHLKAWISWYRLVVHY